MEGEWQEVAIGDAFDVNPYRTIKRGQVSPFIPMDALPGHARSALRIDERKFTGSGTKFHNGDTLIARITPCLENGKTVFVSGLSDGVVAHGSTEYIVLAGKPNQSNNLFAYYLARSPDFRRHAIGHMEGTSGRQRVPSVAIEKYVIALPPLPEQRAIAHILGTLDDKIELNRRMNEPLEAMARALFKSWFVDFDPVRAKVEGRDPGLPKPIANLFPDSFEDSELGEIPKGWEVKTIGDFAEVVGGSTPRTTKTAFWDGGAHHWATPKNLSNLSVPVLLDTERRVTDAGLKQISSGLLPVGTVLLSSRAPIGYLAVAEVPVAINQGFIAMKPRTGVSNLFLLLWTSSAHDEIVSRANGSTFLEISKANFRPIPVVTPSAEVMQKFDQLARPLYKRIVECAREARTLAALRDMLLPKLISGDLRVPDAEQFTAEATA
jgi:type I restriction enzyme S subunit